MTVKKLTGKIHLWLGLASGLIVFIVALTGCLFVFQKEISDVVFHKTFYIAPPKQAQTLPLSLLQQKAQTVLTAQKPVNYITVYKDASKAWEFMAYKTNEQAITYWGAVEYYTAVFMNPYTGEITGVRNYKNDFFYIVKYLHWSLLLNTKYGQPVVGWATFIFVILLISGLVLWWPKKWSRAEKQKAFAIQWKARFKRLNYDLHNVLGFYSLLIALILSLTGMVWSFKWFYGLTYVVANGSAKLPDFKNVQSDTTANYSITAKDAAFSYARKNMANVKRIGISVPDAKNETINIYGYPYNELYCGFEQMQFDQYSGKLLNAKKHNEKNRGEKFLEMNYDIHVGAIGGIYGKIIAFIASLIAASLPVTGFIVWLGKKKKRSK